MSLFGSAQTAAVEVRAQVFPPCECGKPWTAHHIVGSDGFIWCVGYKPSQPIDPVTTRSYTPPYNWPIHRRAIGLALWAIERRCQQWRERLRTRS